MVSTAQLPVHFHEPSKVFLSLSLSLSTSPKPQPRTSNPLGSSDNALPIALLTHPNAKSTPPWMFNSMASPWAVPPPPGTQGQYGYQQSELFIPTTILHPTARSNTSLAPTAYHPVQVRQTFNQIPSTYVPMTQPQGPPPPQAREPPARRTKIEWPQPVRDYVQRSFDPKNLVADIPRSEMEFRLKQTISQATDNNTLDTVDWVHLPLPQEMIRQERAQALWKQESVNMHMAGRGLDNHVDVTSKKRKSREIADDEDSTSTPPWRATNNSNGFEDRVTFQPAKERFDKRQQPFQDDSAQKNSSKFQKALEKRQRRFNGGYQSTYKRSPSPEPTAGPVVGTCQDLEKQYFRLTSAPIPSQVRPESVLKQTLELLKKKWKKEGNYGYICDQFKSMRQDLTVQRIKKEFTVTVYEIHARIALERGDLGEYNQCQTQLRSLYASNLGGNPVEFKAYRILYFIHTCNRTALNDVLADLTIAEKKQKAIKHALDVRSALALGNYNRFFRLYLDTPNMGAYLMDMFVVRERLAALANICKA